MITSLGTLELLRGWVRLVKGSTRVPVFTLLSTIDWLFVSPSCRTLARNAIRQAEPAIGLPLPRERDLRWRRGPGVVHGWQPGAGLRRQRRTVIGGRPFLLVSASPKAELRGRRGSRAGSEAPGRTTRRAGVLRAGTVARSTAASTSAGTRIAYAASSRFGTKPGCGHLHVPAGLAESRASILPASRNDRQASERWSSGLSPEGE